MDRGHLTQLLSERGVTSAEAITEALIDDELEGAFASVAAWDASRSDKTAGLLVWMIRERQGAQYKTPGKRTKPNLGPSTASEALLFSMRGVLNSPNGISREEAHGIYADKAKRLDISVDALIDQAMGPNWQSSPAHPALDKENPNKARDYERWVAGA